MAIALLLMVFGVGINIVMFSQAHKAFPRFANTCQGCGCQTPPMAYPPAVSDCPMCEWVARHNLRHQLGLQDDH